MAFLFSTGCKNNICANESVVATLGSSVVRVYSGIVPVNADAALGSAVQLLEYTVDGEGGDLYFNSVVNNGVVTKDADAWRGTATATGVATFFRLVRSYDTGAASTSEIRVQGSVGVSGADLNLSSTTITSGQIYTLDTFTVSFAG